MGFFDTLKSGLQSVGKYIVNKVSGDDNKQAEPKKEKSTGEKIVDTAVDVFLSINPLTAIGYNANKLDKALNNQQQKVIREETAEDGTVIGIVEEKKTPALGVAAKRFNNIVNYVPNQINKFIENKNEGVSGFRNFFSPDFLVKGATYDGQAMSNEESANLVHSMMYEFNKLNEKGDNRTWYDNIMMDAYRDEFKKIKVIDPSERSFWDWVGINGDWRSKQIKKGEMLDFDPDFMLTMYKDSDWKALGFDEESKRDYNKRLLNGEPTTYMTEDEYNEYNVQGHFDDIKNNIDDPWKKEKKRITPWTPDGQWATESELNRLIYDADGSRAFAMNQQTAIELYKEAKKHGYTTLMEIAERAYEDLERFKLYMLDHSEYYDAAKILDDFIDQYGYNPLKLNITKEDTKKMSSEELAQAWISNLTSFGGSVNFDDAATSIIWAIRMEKDKGWRKGLAHFAELGSVIGNAYSAAIGAGYTAINEIGKVADAMGSAEYKDMGSAYSNVYLAQNSDLFTFKEDVQQQKVRSDFSKIVTKYLSIGDDIVGSFKNIGAVNKVSNKIDKVSRLLLKVEKAGKNGVKISKASKLASGGTKLAGWLADEAVTSSLIQGLVPYEYSDEDLVIDIMGGVVSGVIARNGFKNAEMLFANTKTDTAFADWYILDVLKDKKMYNQLSDYEKKLLGSNIKESLNIGDDMLTNKEFIEKVNEKVKIKNSISKRADELYNRSEQTLMATIYTNPKYSNYVNYNDKTNKYSWNKPQGMSDSKFYKKINSISDDIDKIKYGLRYRNNVLGKIIDRVDADAIKEARKTKEGRKLLKKSKGKYVFKDADSEFKFKNELLVKRLEKSPIGNMFNIPNTYAIYGGFKLNPRDLYKTNKYSRWIDLYINEIINNVHFSNLRKLQGTKIPLGGHINYMAFLDFLKRKTGVDDIYNISTSKLSKYLREFGESLEEEIPQYLRTKYSPEVMDNLGNSKNLIINLPYDDALKINPDLKYMSPETYNRIRSDEDGLHPMEKEIILRGFVKSDIFDGDHMVLKGQEGEKLFNSVFEEKITLGESGEFWIKEGGDIEMGKDMDIEGASMFTYKFSNEEKGIIEYGIYDGDKLVGYLKTFKGPSGVRNVNIKYILSSYEVKNPAIKINKTGELPGAFRYKEDLPRNIPVDKLKVDIDLESIGLPNTDLKTWQTVFKAISGKFSYENFMKILPGYTDRVPAEIFDEVITAKDLNNSQKIAIITSFMFNKNIVETEVGISVGTGKVFNKKGYISGAYEYNPKTKKFEYNSKKYTPGESDILYNSLGDMGYVRISGDIYEYRKTKGGKLNLYKPNVSSSKPVGAIVFTNDSIEGYIHTQGRKHIKISGDLDFSYNKSDDIYKYMSYDSTKSKLVKTDATYEDIYRAIHGRDISDVTLAKLRANRNMTPEKYLNYYIDEFKKNPFSKYAHINYKGSREDIIKQIKNEKNRIDLCVKYKKQFPNTKLTDRQIYEVSQKALVNTPLTLTKAEREIRDIMFDGKKSYSHEDMIHLYGYSKNGIVPEHVDSGIKKRLKDRRKRIANKLYGDMNLTDYEAEKLAKISIEEVTPENIIKDPEGYYAATEALYRQGELIEKETSAAIDANQKIVDESEPLIDDINNKLRKKKGGWKANKEYQKVVVESKIKYLRNEIDTLNQDRLLRLENGQSVADIEKDIANKTYALKVLEEYSQNPEGKVMTSDEFNYIYEQNLNGNYYGDLGYKLSTRQLNANLNAISNNMGSIRILEYDYKTGMINTRGLNAKEKSMFKETLQNAAYKIHSGEASALHLPMLHAIVIDPKNVSMIDVGHEWFHDAVSMMSDQKRFNSVINEAYSKFGKEIESYGASRGYREYLSEYFNDEEIIRKKLAEEWLAERFGEYVQGRSKLSDNVILRFFKELYEKIRMLFSDTKIIDLFDDIYEGRITYSNVQRPLDIDVINKRSPINTSTRRLCRGGNIEFGDDTDLEKHIKDIGVNDALSIFDFNRSGRGNIFTSRMFDIRDYEGNIIKTSFDEVYEEVIGFGKRLIGEGLYNFFDSLEYKELYNQYVKDGGKFAKFYATDTYHVQLSGGKINVFIKSYPDLFRGYGMGVKNFSYDISENLDQSFFKALSKHIYSLDTKDFVVVTDDRDKILSTAPSLHYKLNVMLPDLLEMSVNEYKIGPMHEAFKGVKNIDKIKDILDDAFKNSLFNRLIPHSDFETSKALGDKNYGMFRRKFNKTLDIINRIDALGDKNLRRELSTKYDNAIGINISFDYYTKDNKGKKVKRRKVIGWHMANDDFDTLYKNGYIDEHEYNLLKHIQTNKPSINESVSMQLDRALVDAIDKPETWNRSLLSTDSAKGGDNRFKRILKIANNNNKNVVLIDDMFGKSYVAQKGINVYNLVKGIKNGRFIGSSVAISYQGVGSGFGDCLLIARKDADNIVKGNRTFYSGDSFTVLFDNFIAGDIVLTAKDIIEKGGDLISGLEKKYNIGIHKSIGKEIDKLIKGDAGTIDLRSDHYKDKFPGVGRIIQNRKDQIAESLIKDDSRIKRIINEAFKGIDFKADNISKKIDVEDMKILILLGDDNQLENLNKISEGIFNISFEDFSKGLTRTLVNKYGKGLGGDAMTFEDLVNAAYEYTDLSKFNSVKDREIFIKSALMNKAYDEYFLAELWTDNDSIMNYHTIIAKESDYDKIKKALDENKYKYEEVDRYEIGYKDPTSLITDDGFVLIKVPDDFLNYGIFDMYMYVNKRGNIQLTDEYYGALRDKGLTSDVTLKTKEKIAEDMRFVNRVLKDSGYNIKNDIDASIKTNKMKTPKTEYVNRNKLISQKNDLEESVSNAKKRIADNYHKREQYKQSKGYKKLNEIGDVLDSNNKASEAFVDAGKKYDRNVIYNDTSITGVKSLNYYDNNVYTRDIPAFLNRDIEIKKYDYSDAVKVTGRDYDFYSYVFRLVKEDDGSLKYVASTDVNDYNKVIDKIYGFSDHPVYHQIVHGNGKNIADEYKGMAKEYEGLVHTRDKLLNINQPKELQVDVEKQIETDTKMYEPMSSSVSDASLVCEIK